MFNFTVLFWLDRLDFYEFYFHPPSSELPTKHWPQHLKHISDMLKELVEDTSIT